MFVRRGAVWAVSLTIAHTPYILLPALYYRLLYCLSCPRYSSHESKGLFCFVHCYIPAPRRVPGTWWMLSIYLLTDWQWSKVSPIRQQASEFKEWVPGGMKATTSGVAGIISEEFLQSFLGPAQEQSASLTSEHRGNNQLLRQIYTGGSQAFWFALLVSQLRFSQNPKSRRNNYSLVYHIVSFQLHIMCFMF